jgi:pimeloyl-ACP methyl ester carboxylesterase
MKQSFLVLLMGLLVSQGGAQINYGTNADAGKYVTVKGTKIYYETYGSGTPLLLLHGSILGYIDEYAQYIPELSKNYKVIAMALRGHGKSELGNEPFSYKLLAEDAMAVLKQEGVEKTAVIGFSAGAITGYYLAANYPNTVTRLVALAGALNSDSYSPASRQYLKTLTLDSLQKRFPDFIAERKKIMVQPDRYQELLTKIAPTWTSGSYTAPAKPSDIKCPVLSIGGDHDFYFSARSFVSVFEQIPNSQLAIIPNADHVAVIMNRNIFTILVYPFLQRN